MIKPPTGTTGCGCCGAPLDAVVNDLASGVARRVENFHRVRLVAGSAESPQTAVYRCERHVGRNPCCIPGCRRTYAHAQADKDGRGPEDYSWRLICGSHWRMAPKFMRDAVSRVRRSARRHGWTDRHHRRHSRLWDRCRRAIESGERLDEAEIARMFGWDVAA